MMKYSFFISILLIVSLSFLNATSTGAKHDHYQQYQFGILGHYNLLQGKPKESQAYYQKLLEDSPSPYVYSNYVRYLFATNQFKAIADLLPRIESTFEHDIDIQLIFAQSLAGIGDQEQANRRFVALQQKHKTNAELTYLAAQAVAQKDPKKATTIVDEYLNSAPFQPRNCLFYFMKSQFHMSLNEKKKAVENVHKSLEICPRFDKGWLLLGMIHEQEGKINEAIKGYSTFLELTGPNKEVESQINALVVKSKLQKQHTHQESYVTSALTWYENQEYEKALTAVNRHLQQDPAHYDARLLKVNILSAMNNLNDATNLLQKWMLEDPTKETWFKALHLLYRAGLDKHQAITILKAVEHKHPDEHLVILYLADAYTQTQQFNEALIYHDKALKLTSDPLLKTKIAFNTARIHFEMNNPTAMKEALDQGLHYGGLFPPLHNLLAYYYVTYGRDTIRAQNYLDQALKTDTANPHFLDTQALIWYKKREYAKAEKLLRKLAKEEPKDHFIQLHLAKAEHKLGKHKQSMSTLTKALQYAQTPQEQLTCKKLRRTFEIS